MSWCRVTWEEIEPELNWDGSWRDLYVLETTVDDWRLFLQFLRAGRYVTRFQDHRSTVVGTEGGVRSLPHYPTSLFHGRDERFTLLEVDVGRVTLNTDFFTPDNIHLDLDPRKVQSTDDADTLFAFMRGLGRALGKPVRLTHENMCDLVICEYNSVGDELRRPRSS